MEKIPYIEGRAREENIIWTINSDYDIAAPEDLIQETEVASLTRYRTMILAGLYKSKERERLIGYFLARKKSFQGVGIFDELMMLSLEESLLKDLASEFSGLSYIEKEVIKDQIEYYDKLRKRKDVYHEIRYTYYTDKRGKIAKTNKRVYDLLFDLKKFKNISLLDKADDYMAHMDWILEEHFHFDKDKDLASGQDFENSEKGQEKDKKGQQKQLEQKDKRPNRIHIEDSDTDQVMSAEFSQYDIGNHEKSYEKDQADAPRDIVLNFDESIAKKIRESYGRSKISEKNLEKLEKELSVGIHKNEKLHITDSFINIKGYKKTLIDAAKAFNEEEFSYKERIYRRNITRLRDSLLQTIRADMDFSMTRLDNGLLEAEKIWRRAVLGDENVFYKEFRDEPGEIVVEILLDASGSQRDRQSMVSIQAYIIAQALSMAGIPCRVSSFNNLFDYTILKHYRDFGDGQAKNKNIFYYIAEGSNRDGLAIATVGKMLEERQEEHKILIVLSDGKPNDERVTANASLSTSNTKAYTGILAIEDTARRVRALRAKGIAVLGVFTGKYEDLAVEQKIFGRDFAYISKIDRFSDIVAIYLKKQISNMLDKQY